MQGTTAARRLELHSAVQELLSIKYGATTLGDTGKETGNLGRFWNYGQNFGGHHGANSYSTQHGPPEVQGGSGMFGKFGVDAPYAPNGEAYDTV